MHGVSLYDNPSSTFSANFNIRFSSALSFFHFFLACYKRTFVFLSSALFANTDTWLVTPNLTDVLRAAAALLDLFHATSNKKKKTLKKIYVLGSKRHHKIKNEFNVVLSSMACFEYIW